jgi:hypothetical protein
MSLCPHGYTAFYDCPECPEPMGPAGVPHWSGGEYVYDATCDCPRCVDYRARREPDQHLDANYKPGHSSDFPF